MAQAPCLPRGRAELPRIGPRSSREAGRPQDKRSTAWPGLPYSPTTFSSRRSIGASTGPSSWPRRSTMPVLADQRPHALLAAQRGALLDPVFGPLGGAAEGPEGGVVAAELDRIIAPLAGGDHAAVEVDDALQLGPAEADLRRRRSGLRKREDGAHQARPRSFRLAGLGRGRAPRSARRAARAAARARTGAVRASGWPDRNSPSRACRRGGSGRELCSAGPGSSGPGCRPSSRPRARRRSPPHWRRSARAAPTMIGPSTCAPEPMITLSLDRRVALAGDAVGRVGAAQGDVLVDGDVVADLGGLADHDEAVVDEEIAADLRAGMDVDRGQEAAEMVDQPGEEDRARLGTASARRGGSRAPRRPDRAGFPSATAAPDRAPSPN